MDNKALTKAKANKADEFYTAYNVILEELGSPMAMNRPYACQEGLKVVCPCDGEDSQFVRWAKEMGQNVVSNELMPDGTGCVRVYKGNLPLDTGTIEDGRFQSKEVVRMMSTNSCVITNPPFSQFRDMMRILLDDLKGEVPFAVLGPMNAVKYAEVFPHIIDCDVWYGHSIRGGDRWFRVPDDYPLSATGVKVDPDGSRWVKVKGVRWFTNMQWTKPSGVFDPIKECDRDPTEYPLFDNFDAICVDSINDIPKYDGVMGVPITFLDKWDASQYTLVGMLNGSNTMYDYGKPVVDGKERYTRLLIQRRDAGPADIDELRRRRNNVRCGSQL